MNKFVIPKFHVEQVYIFYLGSRDFKIVKKLTNPISKHFLFLIFISFKSVFIRVEKTRKKMDRLNTQIM